MTAALTLTIDAIALPIPSGVEAAPFAQQFAAQFGERMNALWRQDQAAGYAWADHLGEVRLTLSIVDAPAAAAETWAHDVARCVRGHLIRTTARGDRP